MSRTKQQPVHDEYGEIVGYLEAVDGDRGVRVLDAEGQQVATAHSFTIGKRHLLNLA